MKNVFFLIFLTVSACTSLCVCYQDYTKITCRFHAELVEDDLAVRGRTHDIFRGRSIQHGLKIAFSYMEFGGGSRAPSVVLVSKVKESILLVQTRLK